MFDLITNDTNKFYSADGAGSKPNPYDPDWVKKDGEWYYKGKKYKEKPTEADAPKAEKVKATKPKRTWKNNKTARLDSRANIKKRSKQNDK